MALALTALLEVLLELLILEVPVVPALLGAAQGTRSAEAAGGACACDLTPHKVLAALTLLKICSRR